MPCSEALKGLSAHIIPARSAVVPRWATGWRVKPKPLQMTAGLRQAGLFKDEGHDQGEEADGEDLGDPDHQRIAFAGGDVGEKDGRGVEDG